MKRAISNIAWTDAVSLSSIADLLHKHGVDGIECAPTKLVGDVATASDNALHQAKKQIEDLGFCIPAFQSILYGHPELSIFDTNTHARLLEHMKHVVNCANALGAEVLVFGSPKNRVHNSTLLDGALDVAISVFNQLGDIAQDGKCIVGIEANPRDYGCNFLTTTCEASCFVRKVNHPNVKLHIDTGACILNHESIIDVLKNNDFCHLHLSAPHLQNIADFSKQYYECVCHVLSEIDYRGWSSIEMKSVPSGNEVEHIEIALKTAFN